MPPREVKSAKLAEEELAVRRAMRILALLLAAVLSAGVVGCAPSGDQPRPTGGVPGY